MCPNGINAAMQCLKLHEKSKEVNLMSCPIPTITSDDEREVVIKVALAGVCGTDLHIIEGKFKAVDGVTLGHEFVGTITEVAKNETTFKVGDRVAVNPNVTCGVCEECRRGFSNFCLQGAAEYTVGITVDGGWAQYCKVRTSLVFKLADSLHFDQAVLAEPLSCITHSLDVIPPFKIGGRILVIGAGIIGLLWCSLLHFFGHRNVTVVQRSAARRKTFQNLGLDYKIMSWEELEQCHKICKDWTFDVAIDNSGNINGMMRAIPLLRNGGTLVLFGVADPDHKLSVSPFEMYKKELKIIGTAINTHTSFHSALNLLQDMGDRYFTTEKLNMKHVPLKNYKQALKDLNDRLYTKIIFDCK